ncbi:MAG: helix-turn-helix domain-containing protein [Acidimicrobiales bacterium]
MVIEALDGEVLRRLRLRTGRTQAEVAAAVGIPAPVLSAYERGRRQPGIATASRIVAELGYRIVLEEQLDPHVQARRLVDVLGLAEALPYRPRPLARPRR